MESGKPGIIERLRHAVRERLLSVIPRRAGVAVKVLQDSEELLGSIFLNSPLGISIAAPDGRMVKTNRAFCELVGYSEEELGRLNFQDITHPDDLSASFESMQSLLDGKTRSSRMEKRYIRKNGRFVWAELNFSLLRDDAGEPRYFIAQIEDIGERKYAEHAYKDAAARYRTILEATTDGFWAVGLETGRLLDVNDSYVWMSGYSCEELLAMSISDLEANERPEDTAAHILKVIREGADLFETRHRRKDGAIIDVEVSAMLQPETNQIFCFLRDISQRKAAEKQLRLLAMVFENSGEGILITDAQNRIEKVNLSFTRLTGYRQEEVFGKNPRILSSGLQSREFYASMWQCLLQEGFWQGEIWDRRKNGETYPKWLSISVIRNERKEIVNYIGSFSDIAELKRAEKEIEKLAYHDPLTGLPNRFSLLAQLEQAMAKARRNHGRLALMFIDLDRFKIINDTLGHHIGDMLIVKVGKRLRNSIRESDVVARLGGDEFVVLLTDMPSTTEAGVVAAKIVNDLSLSYVVEGISLFSSPSVGISIYPDDGDNINTIMKNADTAMYQAKSTGGNGYRFFDAVMTQKSSERLNFENGLRCAQENGEFELHYQPQVQADGKIRALEALIRWRHPEFGQVPPARFIAIAEETGLILGIGKWVLRTACMQLKTWAGEGFRGIRIAVNVSSQEFMQDDFTESVEEIVREAGIRPDQLELEITESVAMANPERIIGIMRSLRAASIRLSIDDFGTGYSSLAYLKLFPIDQIKIDRSFIKDMDIDANDKTITVSTIALAQKLGLEVVAEGVESARQSDILFAHGCDLIQGFVFSKPLPAGAITALLKKG